jgi:tetratricopeptide (TPR) repeat protein
VCYEHYPHDELAKLVRDEDFVFATAHLLQCAALLDEVEGCERLYELLLPYADQNVANSSHLFYGSAHYSLGLAAARLGREDDARAHLQRAVDDNRSMGNRSYLARSLAALARVEADAGEREQARARLAEARAIAAEGLPGVARLVERAASQGGLG